MWNCDYRRDNGRARWMSVDRRDLWVGWHLNPEKKGANCSGRVVTYDLVKSNRSTRPRYYVRLIDLSPPKLQRFLPFVPRKSMPFTDWSRIYGPVNVLLPANLQGDGKIRLEITHRLDVLKTIRFLKFRSFGWCLGSL